MTLLLVIFLLGPSVQASQGQTALDQALNAAYRQSGASTEVQEIGDSFKRRYIRPEIEPYWVTLIFLVNTVTHAEIRVKFDW